MKIFAVLLASLSLTFSAPIPSPEAYPEPCLEIIFGILQLFLTTTPSPRRREYTTPDDDEPDAEPTTEPSSSTDTQPTEGNLSGESADGPSVNGSPNADSPSTTEGNPDDDPNEIIPKNGDTKRKLRKKPKKKENDWWFSGMKW